MMKNDYGIAEYVDGIVNNALEFHIRNVVSNRWEVRSSIFVVDLNSENKLCTSNIGQN